MRKGRVAEVVAESSNTNQTSKPGTQPIVRKRKIAVRLIESLACEVHRSDTMRVPSMGRPRESEMRKTRRAYVSQALNEGVVEDRKFIRSDGDCAVYRIPDLHSTFSPRPGR